MERLHFLEGELMSKDVVAGFPFNEFTADFDVPSARSILHENLAIRHRVRVPSHAKLIATLANSCDVEPHSRRQVSGFENVPKSSFEIVDRSLRFADLARKPRVRFTLPGNFDSIAVGKWRENPPHLFHQRNVSIHDIAEPQFNAGDLVL